MDYISTRGGLAPTQFTDILLGGLAPDGGLTVPAAFPVLDPEELASWRGLDYRQLAYQIISQFATDIPADTLRELID
ncbi:MAG: threonine synthase, partial [Candidatus Competibacteraceae bacterium]|nr:threonine synthase [Candidatus Competibacteraceae bacterium]